jgi:hypothetical protein
MSTPSTANFLVVVEKGGRGYFKLAGQWGTRDAGMKEVMGLIETDEYCVLGCATCTNRLVQVAKS